MFKRSLIGAGLAACFYSTDAMATPEDREILEHYAEIASAKYEDSLAAARVMDRALQQLTQLPNEETLQLAKFAWKAARKPYLQTEAFRFGNPFVDDWEPRVNSWPLDEGLIDYVVTDNSVFAESSEYANVNIIANPNPVIGGRNIDASSITPDFLEGVLQGLGGVETNVATGYHAIEFLLWGQDHSDGSATAGSRPATDYDITSCTNENCGRRAEYLLAASKLLLRDLEHMVDSWADGGEARTELMAGDSREKVIRFVKGLGSLTFGELAGERIKLGLMLGDQEEEHDCFSDFTHVSHFYDALGIANLYYGRYRRLDGTVLIGASLHQLVSEQDPALAVELADRLDATMGAMSTIKFRGNFLEPYDLMIQKGNNEGNAVVQAGIEALVVLSQSLERVLALLREDISSTNGSTATFE